jgi:uncharacterized protein YggE
MTRSSRSLAALAALVLPLAGCAARAAAQPADTKPAGPTAPLAPPPTFRTIRASGEGKVAVKPDVARVTTGVQATGKDLAKTTADAAARVRRILDELARLGLAEKDLQTTRHDVQVERPWDNGRPGPITGYTVSDEIRVTVRDLSKLPQVLERVIAVGSNVLQGLSFERDDPAPAQAEALARAVQAARTKAEAMARAAGVTLGEPLAIEEGGGRVAPPVPWARAEMMMAKDAGGAPVAAGELEIVATADVTFAIR